MSDYRQYNVDGTDRQIASFIRRARQLQEGCVELTASENYVSPAVMAAVGSVLSNGNAEQCSARARCGMREILEGAERLAVERAKALFGADAANVQPHSVCQANQAVLFSVLEPRDSVLYMHAAGGRPSHGAVGNVSGGRYNFFSYGLNEREEIDYDAMERLARIARPKLIIAGSSSYPLEIDFARFARVARDIGAYLLVDMAGCSGLVAGGVCRSPVPYADFVTAPTHEGLRGPQGGLILMRSQHEERIKSAVFPGVQGPPLPHVIAGKAVALAEALEEDFKRYQRQVLQNAKEMADVLAWRGLRIVAGKTQNHTVLVDLRADAISGSDAERLLSDAGIACSKSKVPKDPHRTDAAGGILLGTSAITTRGFGVDEAASVANLIADLMESPDDGVVLARARECARALCGKFPVYLGRYERAAVERANRFTAPIATHAPM